MLGHFRFRVEYRIVQCWIILNYESYQIRIDQTSFIISNQNELDRFLESDQVVPPIVCPYRSNDDTS
jgi:hypothetical protein